MGLSMVALGRYRKPWTLHRFVI